MEDDVKDFGDIAKTYVPPVEYDRLRTEVAALSAQLAQWQHVYLHLRTLLGVDRGEMTDPQLWQATETALRKLLAQLASATAALEVTRAELASLRPSVAELERDEALTALSAERSARAEGETRERNLTKMAAELSEARAEDARVIEQLQAKLHCVCGSPIDHSPWEGHSPVSMYDYALDEAFARAEQAESALASVETARKQAHLDAEEAEDALAEVECRYENHIDEIIKAHAIELAAANGLLADARAAISDYSTSWADADDELKATAQDLAATNARVVELEGQRNGLQEVYERTIREKERAEARVGEWRDAHYLVCQQAERAEAERDALREALEPFGCVDGEGDEDFPDLTRATVVFGRSTHHTLTLGHFRKARTALAGRCP